MNKKILQKAIKKFKKLSREYDGFINVVFEKNQAAFITEDMYLVSRLIDGSFPDYKQIIPKHFGTTATVLKNDLIMLTMQV